MSLSTGTAGPCLPSRPLLRRAVLLRRRAFPSPLRLFLAREFRLRKAAGLLSDRTKCLALYHTHCTDGIGTASVHTSAERRGGQAALRLSLVGSYIRIAQLHRDDSARQDQLNERE